MRTFSVGKQQKTVVVAAAAPAKPAAKAIESKKSTMLIAARLFSAAAAAMIAVTGPAFADLNSLEAAAGGGVCQTGIEGGNEQTKISKSSAC